MPDLFRTSPSSDGFIEVIVKFSGDLAEVSKALNARYEILTCNYAVLTIAQENLEKLNSFKEIEYAELPKRVTYQLINELEASCVPPVQNESGLGLTGKGVIVGIIDSGIDYTHRDFRNADGTSRILYLWDQNIGGAPPAGFISGTEYSQAQINAALQNERPFSVVPSDDRIGHGTAVAGIAAGNGNESEGRERGAAPQAGLIVVKLEHGQNRNFSRTTDVLRGAKYLLDKAQVLNMPLSVNISFGTNDGSHDGNSLFESCLNSMCQSGKTVIVAATGNEGSAGHHYYTKLVSGETRNIDFVCAGNPNVVYMTLWKNFVDKISFELISPQGRSSGILEPPNDSLSVIVDGVRVTMRYNQPTHYSVQQEVYLFMESERAALQSGIWKLIARCSTAVDGTLNIWLPTLEDVAKNTAFLNPDPNNTLTMPSTVQNIISVGGYNSAFGSFAAFSGRGGLDPVQKPDLTAPAVNVLTCRSGGGYDIYTGTSMAAPFVCGAAALMMEWGIIQGNDPFLYGQKIKAFLQRGAKRDTNVNYPSNQWGYGRLYLCDTMDELEENLSGRELIH